MYSLGTNPKSKHHYVHLQRCKYIGETIESVRSQTWQNWELIIVDDGSDDNTCEIITGIKDERIHLYKAGRIGINGRIKNIGLGVRLPVN